MKIKADLINKLVAQHEQLGVDASIQIVDALDASIARLGLSADLSPVNKLAVAIELGDFIIQRMIDDGVLVDDMSTAIDEFVMAFFKTLTDDAALADQVANDFVKVLQDVGLVTDIQVVAFFKGLSDTTASTDSVAWLVEKPVEEEVLGLEDYVVLLTKKAPEEVVGTSDSIDQFAVTKGLVHATAVGSHVATSLSKPLQDAADLTDTLTLLTEKAFLDAPAVGDNNALTVGKSTTDVSHITDTLHIQTSFARAFAEASTVSGHTQLHVVKSVADDGAAFTEQLSIATSRWFADQSSVLELISKGATKSFIDTYGVSDEFDKVLNKQPDDTTVFVDDMVLLSQGYVSDTFYFADDYIGTSRTA